jgi:hypothetical protein
MIIMNFTNLIKKRKKLQFILRLTIVTEN